MTPDEFAVLGNVKVKVETQVPIAVIVASPCIQVVFPSVLERVELTVNVAVPHVKAGVYVVQAIPVSPVPPFATGSGEVIEIAPVAAAIARGAEAVTAGVPLPDPQVTVGVPAAAGTF